MICGHGHEQKFKYPYPWDSKIIQIPYFQAKAIDQIPTLCPASPLAGLTLIGALQVLAPTSVLQVINTVHKYLCYWFDTCYMPSTSSNRIHTCITQNVVTMPGGWGGGLVLQLVKGGLYSIS